MKNNNKYSENVLRMAKPVLRGVGVGSVSGLTVNWLGRGINKCIVKPTVDWMSKYEKARSCIGTVVAVASFIASPTTAIHTYLRTKNYEVTTISIHVAPLTEEPLYRLFLQGGLKVGLIKLGLEPLLATSVSIASISILFGAAHDEALEGKFTVTTLAGVIFGLLQERQEGFPEGISQAVIAHMIHNLIINYGIDDKVSALAARVVDLVAEYFGG